MGLNRYRLNNLLLMIPFLCLFYLELHHHAVWRDEINAWALVRSSPTLAVLFANLHYDGHPSIWYLLLYLGSKLTRAAWMLKFVEALVGTGIYLMLAMTTPFRRIELVLIYLSYFLVFEYTVMSRMYGLELLLALVYIHLRMHNPDAVARNVFFLGIIANVDSTGVLLSLGLLVEYLWNFCQQHREDGRSCALQSIRALLLYLLMVGISVATMLPAKHISTRGHPHSIPMIFLVKLAGRAIVNWVVMLWFPEHVHPGRMFWGVHGTRMSYACLIPVMLALYYFVFRTERRLATMLAIVACLGIMFSTLLYPIAAMRHFGILYIAFLVALWIMRYRRAVVSPLVYVFLVLSTLGGLAAEYGQWSHPFADDTAAANWLQKENLQNASLIGTPDANVFGVPELLDRPMYQLDCECVDTYMKYSNRRDSYSVRQMPDRLVGAVHLLKSSQMILIMNRLIYPAEDEKLKSEGVATSPLASFTSGDISNEHIYLYKIDLSP